MRNNTLATGTQAFLAVTLLWVGTFAHATCGKETGERQGPGAEPRPSASTWPTFRGDGQFRGVAPGKLGDAFKLAWTFQTGEAIKSSASVGGGLAFVGSDDGHLYALELGTGHECWKVKTDGPIEAPPLAIHDRVYVGSDDGLLYAIDSKSGQIVWKHPTEGRIVGGANWHESPDGGTRSILVGSYDNFVYSVDAQTGERRWRFETENYINGAPAVVGDHAIFGGCDGYVYVVSIARGQLVSQIELGSPIASTIAVRGDSAYIGHYGNAFARIDLQAKEIVWEFNEDETPFFSSAAIVDDRVVFGSRARRVYCVNDETGEQNWSFLVPGQMRRVDSSPVICGDKVVIGSESGRLFVLRLETGEEVWSFEVGEAITASPAVVNGMIIIGSEDGAVYAFAPRNKPTSKETARE